MMLQIDYQKALEDFAESLNKRTDELTDDEKKQAVLNATLKLAEEKVDK